MKIKVCGLRDIENLREVYCCGADYLGFIFHKSSPRYVNDNLSFDEMREIKLEKVGVFVNEKQYSVFNNIAHYDLDLIQLHGNENPEYCRELKSYARIIKAFGISKDFDFRTLKKYENAVDYFLFDTASVKHGGSGIQFDWSLLKNYESSIPFFLSGGISEFSVETIKQLKFENLFGIDINSKFEISPGIKDVTRIEKFIKKIKQNE